ncbi:TraR/DksA family transcriptional regulator [Planctomycetota bacterium]
MTRRLNTKRFETLLLDKRRELLRNFTELETDAVRSMTESIPQNPSHPAEAGTDTFELDNNAGLMESERQLLKDVDRALERLEQDTFGRCDQCNKRIPKARLEAIPWTQFCFACAEAKDRQNTSVPKPRSSYRLRPFPF